MKRGELYRVYKASSHAPKTFRVFVVVSRQTLIESRFSTVTCAPVYSAFDGLSTQIRVGPAEGLKHESAIHCDQLISIAKKHLTDFTGALSQAKIIELNKAMANALDLQAP